MLAVEELRKVSSVWSSLTRWTTKTLTDSTSTSSFWTTVHSASNTTLLKKYFMSSNLLVRNNLANLLLEFTDWWIWILFRVRRQRSGFRGQRRPPAVATPYQRGWSEVGLGGWKKNWSSSRQSRNRVQSNGLARQQPKVTFFCKRFHR